MVKHIKIHTTRLKEKNKDKEGEFSSFSRDFVTGVAKRSSLHKIFSFCTIPFFFSLKGPCHASVHVQHLDFWSGVPFFQDWLLVKKSSSIDPEMPEKAITSVFLAVKTAIWSILENLNVILCIFVQALSRKFEVIKEKCTKAYYFLSVFLQTDQMWRLCGHLAFISVY